MLLPSDVKPVTREATLRPSHHSTSASPGQRSLTGPLKVTVIVLMFVQGSV